MRNVVFIDGPNFSGRSKHLGAWLMAERSRGPVVYIGPSIASALTGLAATVASELDLYRSWKAVAPAPIWRDYFGRKSDQLLTSLSGGEQVLLALAGTARPDIRGVAIDCALEQLDEDWRTWALAHLRAGPGVGVVQFADNRTPSAGEPYDETIRMPAGPAEYPVQLEALIQECSGDIPDASLVVEGLTFGYPHGPLVFRKCSLNLLPRHVYRLRGPNGAGKSTLIRLLCGVLPFQDGAMFLNGRPYRPYREGNRLISLSMQNSDDQWTDVSIAGDLQRRLRHVVHSGSAPILSVDALISKCAHMLGVGGRLRQHLLDFPRVLRKRLSWIWPLSGYLPWLVFDEPTLGQDDATVAQFAGALRSYAARGYGVIYVAHDHRLPLELPGTDLLLGGGEISIRN